MDFITHLPVSFGHTVIWVICDRLTKYIHLIGLPPKFTAPDLAKRFSVEICRLHGLPKSIISDRDPLFLSSFWKELFRVQGTTLKYSTTYHPETDGQTEVVNRCLEAYLRCFTGDHPRQWFKFLHLAEYWHNSSFHSSIQMTPFQALYGRPPPAISDYVTGSTNIQSLDTTLQEHHTVLQTLKDNLKRSRQRMVTQANKKRVDCTFNIGDPVLLKLQPYRQQTVFRRTSQKLAKRYFGPFTVIRRIGQVSYELDLPPSSRIHPVFHVSLLRPYYGEDPSSHFTPLPTEICDSASAEENNACVLEETSKAEDLVKGKATEELDKGLSEAQTGILERESKEDHQVERKKIEKQEERHSDTQKEREKIYEARKNLLSKSKESAMKKGVSTHLTELVSLSTKQGGPLDAHCSSQETRNESPPSTQKFATHQEREADHAQTAGTHSKGASHSCPLDLNGSLKLSSQPFPHALDSAPIKGIKATASSHSQCAAGAKPLDATNQYLTNSPPFDAFLDSHPPNPTSKIISLPNTASLYQHAPTINSSRSAPPTSSPPFDRALASTARSPPRVAPNLEDKVFVGPDSSDRRRPKRGSKRPSWLKDFI